MLASVENLERAVEKGDMMTISSTSSNSLKKEIGIPKGVTYELCSNVQLWNEEFEYFEKKSN